MVRLTDRYLQEEGHQEAQVGTLLGGIGEWDSGWVALECDCRAKLLFEAQSAVRPSRRVLECGVCGKGFARSGPIEAPQEDRF
jgi:hypothetical protein